MERMRDALAIESWTLYAVGVCLIVSRITFRLITLRSPHKLQLDDWAMMAVLIPFTGSVFCANGALFAASPEIDNNWPRKMRFALEEFQITTNWLVKACLLILYRRIFPASTSRTEHRLVACTSIFCVFAYCIIQILLPIWCRSVRDYWTSEPSNTQCTTYRSHSILTLAFSSATTIATLIIPVPLIRTPRKFLLAILLLLGIFVLVSGILARYYALIVPASSAYLNWLVAETALMILFANLPFLSPLVASTAPARSYRTSSTLSLSQWPRSYKDTPPLRAECDRLDSIATMISTLSPTPSHRLGSTASSLHRLDVDDGWADVSPASTVPPAPVRRLKLTDPPPELEVYWKTRRPSTRDVDLEKLDQQEKQCPLR